MQHIAQKNYIYSMISKEERHDFILVKIKKERKLAMTDLAAELGVSEHTVRRDLKELSDAGLLRAIRGWRHATFKHAIRYIRPKQP